MMAPHHKQIIRTADLLYPSECTVVHRMCELGIRDEHFGNTNAHAINPFQSNFSANRILPSSYLFWVGKRLVDYL